MTAVRLLKVETFERPVRLRLPFRFGMVTLTEAPQLFVKATVLVGADEAVGWSAELLVPKWFDKSPNLSNENNFEQLRRAVVIATDATVAAAAQPTPFALHVAASGTIARDAREDGLPPLAAQFGPAIIDRAILDAFLRSTGTDVFTATRQNRFGLTAALTPDLAEADIARVLSSLDGAPTIAMRHTVGLADALTAGDLIGRERVGDGLPETLEEVIAATGITHFKLKVCGDVDADVARLAAIAAVLEPLPRYAATLDGNEQFGDVDGALALWEAIAREPRLRRLRTSIVFVEQPIARASALSRDIGPLASKVPVEIDESDGTIDSFREAATLGYTGVSSKSCKGFYKSLLNRVRCAVWESPGGSPAGYFMSAEDLTTQSGLALQQDLALAALVGCTHVERNGHHYANGMSAAPEDEQAAFLAAHRDLYEKTHGAVRPRIHGGELALGSLRVQGLASGALPTF